MKDYSYATFYFFQASQPRVGMLSCDALIIHSGINPDFHSVLLPLLLESGRSLQCLHLVPSVIILAGRAFERVATSIGFTRQLAPMWVLLVYLMCCT